VEFVEMYGVHPTLSFGLAKLARTEQLQRAERARMLHAAGNGAERRPGIVAAIRVVFGGGMIALGQWIHGGYPEQAEGAAALRMAR
jgi:hypothetical protein